MRTQDIQPGQRFGKLEIIKKSIKTGLRGTTMFECRCDCGKISTVLARSLVVGHTKSCGHCRDISAQDRFGKLVVIKKSALKGPQGATMYECQCDCGKQAVVMASRLKNGTTKSCGHCRDISINDRFGKLTVLGQSAKSGNTGITKYDCRCDCGNVVSVAGSYLRNGHTKSCGNCPSVNLGDKYGKLTVIKKSEARDAFGKIKYDCLCECGRVTSVTSNSLKRGNTKSCGHCTDIGVGDRFGKLTIAGISEKKGPRGALIYDCVCDCGNLTSVRASNLKSGLTRSCGCLLKHNDRSYAIIYRNYRNRIVYASSKLGLDYDITMDDYLSMIDKPCFYCGSSGKNIGKDYDYSFKKNISDTTLAYNGIDRIDSNKGYLKGNVVTCCVDCNRAKCDMTLDEFKQWVVRAGEFNAFLRNGGKRKIISVTPLDMERKSSGGRRMLADETAVMKDLYYRKITANSRVRNIPASLSLDEFNVLVRQPCHYCGILGSEQSRDIVNKKNGHRKSDVVIHHNGIDRIDSRGMYSKENVVSCCWQCNRAKNKRHVEDYQHWIEQLYIHFGGK